MKFFKGIMISFYICTLISLSTTSIFAQTITPQLNTAPLEQPKPTEPPPPPKEEIKNYIVPKDSVLKVILKKEINSNNCKAGDPIELKLSENLIIDGKVIFPQNSVLTGKIIELQKLSMIKGSYNLKGEVSKVDTPFGKEYPIKGHLNFEFTKKSSKKGNIFSFKFRTDDPADLFPDKTTETKKYNKGEEPLVIPVDTELDLHIDEDNVITIKRKL